MNLKEVFVPFTSVEMKIQRSPSPSSSAGERVELPSALEPESVVELLRQWTISTESVIPLSLAECLLIAYDPHRHMQHVSHRCYFFFFLTFSCSYRQSDFQAQRAAFATLATHLPTRNYATLRRLALYFHTVHIHPSIFIRAGIPIESALLRPYWKDTSASGKDGQLRLEASAKMYWGIFSQDCFVSVADSFFHDRISVLVDEYDFVFLSTKSPHQPFEGTERIPEKDRDDFLRDLRQVLAQSPSTLFLLFIPFAH